MGEITPSHESCLDHTIFLCIIIILFIYLNYPLLLLLLLLLLGKNSLYSLSVWPICKLSTSGLETNTLPIYDSLC